jgi:choline dehydrogenase-like flavoprotein
MNTVGFQGMISMWAIPYTIISAMAVTETYDFVVIGGGTAGLVLANRLTANPEWTVAVLEAGGDVSADPRVLIPALFTAAVGSEIDWSIKQYRK